MRKENNPTQKTSDTDREPVNNFCLLEYHMVGMDINLSLILTHYCSRKNNKKKGLRLLLVFYLKFNPHDKKPLFTSGPALLVFGSLICFSYLSVNYDL